jgi:hypothetical protein
MQRSEALWGSDAQSWKPERWLDAKEAARHNANFEFVPFNAGPRIVRPYFTPLPLVLILFALNLHFSVSWPQLGLQRGCISPNRSLASVQVPFRT